MPLSVESMITLNVLQNKWWAEQKRKEEAANKLDLYHDDYEEIIREKMKELFCKANINRLYYHVNQSQNILKRVINEISTIYKVEPQRDYNEDKRYEEILGYLDLNTKLKKVNCYVNLLNECLIKVGERKGKIVYDIITPNMCMVLQNEDDPTEADAIIYTTTSVNDVSKTDILYHYWDVEGSYRIFDGGFKLKKIVYDPEDPRATKGRSPYIDKKLKQYVMPFVVFRRQEPDSAFWDQDTGRDLYNATIMTGIKMTLLDYYFKVATFKQIYTVGDVVEIPNNQISDPLTIFRVSGENATVGLLDMQINMNQLKEAIEFQINSVINNYGISADMWTLTPGEMSGRALKIKNERLLEIRENQLPFYRKAELELFEITRIVNNAHFSQKISENVEFSIDFGELEWPEDPKEELKLDIMKWGMGLYPTAQLYMKYNPDITDQKKAIKKWRQNIEDTLKFREENPSLDAELNKILGQRGGFGGAVSPEGEEEEE